MKQWELSIKLRLPLFYSLSWRVLNVRLILKFYLPEICVEENLYPFSILYVRDLEIG